MNTAEYTFIHRTFSEIDLIIGQKENFNKYRKIEMVYCSLYHQSGIKLQINVRKMPKHTQNYGD